MAVLSRLKACDEVMNNFAGLGDGEALNPSGQWSDQPGDLPEPVRKPPAATARNAAPTGAGPCLFESV